MARPKVVNLADYREPAVKLSLAEFAKDRRPVPGACERWFLDHPEVMAETVAGLKKHAVGVVWRWLRQEHGFPFSVTAMRAFDDRHHAQ